MAPSVDSYLKCPFCPCIFFSQSDLDVHLKAFGRVPHERLWRCVHLLLEVDGHDAGVDAHGDWSRGKRVRPQDVRWCRVLMRAERSDESNG